MKFLIDMPVTPDTVPWLRAAGHEAVHAAAVGLAHASDRQVLDVARHEGRIVITADLDYPRLLALQQADGPGVILFRGGSYTDTEMLGLLDRVLAQSAALDLEHSIVVVNRRRIRRRPYPSVTRGRRRARSARPPGGRRQGSTQARPADVLSGMVTAQRIGIEPL